MQSGTAASEREAICNALTTVVAEYGWSGTTVSRVARAAHVEPATFYDHFRSLEACFVAVYERMLERVTRTAARLVAAREQAPGSAAWQEQLDAVFSGLLLFFSLEPALARACLVEVLAAGPAARARRDAALDDFARYVEGLRLANGEPMPPLAAELIALGTTDLLHRRVARGEAEALPALLPDLRALWHSTVERHAPVAPVAGASRAA